MKLKLTAAEFNSLYLLLTEIVNNSKPIGILHHVVYGIIYRVFRKFYNKAIQKKREYKITLDADEACAFYLFFSKNPLSNQDFFTQNLIHTINNKIHQIYS
ncbi:MAG: hypothetical protein IT249_19975 [Chitinophagaceae bacterium]|nr:hypothetical protein [Chitinophagaceae bacterium]